MTQSSVGFTMVPHHTMVLLYSLPASQSKVLSFIVRRTIGWHKRHDSISLSQFENGVGTEPGTSLTRHTIIDAIRMLELRGLIQVMRLVTTAGDSATSVYTLCDAALAPAGSLAVMPGLRAIADGVVQPLPHGGREKNSHTKTKAKTKEPSSPSSLEKIGNFDDDFLPTQATSINTDSPISQVEKAETGGHSHAQTSPGCGPAIESEPEVSEPANVSSVSGTVLDSNALCERSDGATENVFDIPPYRTTPEPSSGLTEALLGLHFSRRVITDILGRYPAEQVRQVLEFLPQRKARNPAAYLLSELQAGDYAPPVSKTAPRRVFGLPSPTPEEQARVQAENTLSERLQEAIHGLDLHTRNALLQEAKRRATRLGCKQASDDALMVRLQFEILIKDRVMPAGTLERSA